MPRPWVRMAEVMPLATRIEEAGFWWYSSNVNMACTYSRDLEGAWATCVCSDWVPCYCGARETATHYVVRDTKDNLGPMQFIPV